ncbi:MAG: hypothetical protein M3Z03_14140 [Actinomycetota bacterium]|nr:hypothetical protein [Actinomycetota bacterium]
MTTDRSHQHPGHHHDVLGDPHAQLSAALVLSLVLWMPFGMAVLRQDLDLLGAGVRYLVAFVGCRIAISGFAHLLLTYRALVPVELPDEPTGHHVDNG